MTLQDLGTTGLEQLAVPFRDVRGSALRWALDLPERAALASRTVHLSSTVSVELRVLGASHQVVLRRAGERVFSETVACDVAGGEPLPAQLNRSGYAFTSHTDVLDPAQLAARVDDVLASTGGRTDALAAAFPGDPLAVTALAVSAEGPMISWRTWHAYPQAGELVQTRTQITEEMASDV